MNAPAPSSRAHRCLNALAPGFLKGTVVRSYPVVWSLALRPADTNQDPVVYGAEFGSVPGGGSTFCIHTGGSRLPRPLPFGF